MPEKHTPNTASYLILEKDDLPENTIGYVAKVIDEMDDGLEYQEVGWN